MNNHEELLFNKYQKANTVVGKLLNLFFKNRRSAESVVVEWLQRGNKLCMQSIANDLAENVKDELKLNHISFTTLKKNGHTLFFLRNIDESALDLCVATVRYRMSKETTIYSYKEFNEHVATNEESKKISYLTGLSEVEMEYLRRDITQKGGGKSLSITRMDDDTWMMGFLSEDLIDLNPRKRRMSPIMESLFRMILDLHGEKKQEIQKRLKSSISADRHMAKTTSEERVKSTRSFYVYDPVRPKRSIYLSKDYWCVVETQNLNSPEIKFMPSQHTLFSRPEAMVLLNSELLRMQYKAICYDETTLYRAVLDYQQRALNEEPAIQNYQDANKEISKTLYDAFAFRHEKDNEFHQLDISKQTFVCLTEAQILLNAFINNEVIDNRVSRTLSAISEKYSFKSSDLTNVINHFKFEPILEKEAAITELSLMQRISRAEEELREELAIAESISIEKGV